jgi:hypothetical protein
MAAATIGASNGLLGAGEPAALVLGALVTIGALAAATALAAKQPAFHDQETVPTQADTRAAG